jgi:hypothetical protein
MPYLPARFAAVILAFAPLFVHRSWRHARVLLIGAILTPGRRTVASVLRIMGRSGERRFVNYHRVLSRAAWCPRAGARILLELLLDAFVPHGPVVMALDDTIERRWGRRIRARGIYRDPVRSSDAHFVKTSGLRWMSLILLAPVPWAGRIWALPFLTTLVPSERTAREQGGRHRSMLDLLALFSIVTLLAARLPARQRQRIAATAWYPKPQPTFSDALAAVRRALWREQGLRTSRRPGHRTKRRFVLPPPWASAICSAA